MLGVEVGLGDMWPFGALRMGDQKGRGDLLSCAGCPSPSLVAPDLLQVPSKDFPLSLCFLSWALISPSVAYAQSQQESRDLANQG